MILHFNTANTILPAGTNYVMGPMGKNLPANVTFDSYFEELQKQWNWRPLYQCCRFSVYFRFGFLVYFRFGLNNPKIEGLGFQFRPKNRWLRFRLGATENRKFRCIDNRALSGIKKVRDRERFMQICALSKPDNLPQNYLCSSIKTVTVVTPFVVVGAFSWRDKLIILPRNLHSSFKTGTLFLKLKFNCLKVF